MPTLGYTTPWAAFLYGSVPINNWLRVHRVTLEAPATFTHARAVYGGDSDPTATVRVVVYAGHGASPSVPSPLSGPLAMTDIVTGITAGVETEFTFTPPLELSTPGEYWIGVFGANFTPGATIFEPGLGGIKPHYASTEAQGLGFDVLVSFYDEVGAWPNPPSPWPEVEPMEVTSGNTPPVLYLTAPDEEPEAPVSPEGGSGAPPGVSGGGGYGTTEAEPRSGGRTGGGGYADSGEHRPSGVVGRGGY